MLQTAETRATAPETAHDVNPTGEWMRCGHPHWTEGHRTSDCIRNKYWYDEGVIVERRRGWRERRLVQGITGNVLRAASVGRAEEGRRWRMHAGPWPAEDKARGMGKRGEGSTAIAGQQGNMKCLRCPGRGAIKWFERRPRRCGQRWGGGEAGRITAASLQSDQSSREERSPSGQGSGMWGVGGWRGGWGVWVRLGNGGKPPTPLTSGRMSLIRRPVFDTARTRETLVSRGTASCRGSPLIDAVYFFMKAAAPENGVCGFEKFSGPPLSRGAPPRSHGDVCPPWREAMGIQQIPMPPRQKTQPEVARLCRAPSRTGTTGFQTTRKCHRAFSGHQTPVDCIIRRSCRRLVAKTALESDAKTPPSPAAKLDPEDPAKLASRTPRWCGVGVR